MKGPFDSDSTSNNLYIMEYVKTYCPYCNKDIVHVIWTEDGYGASGTARIFSTLLSMGMSNIVCNTYSKCISCGTTEEL